MDALLGQERIIMGIACLLYAMAFVPALIALLRKKEHPHWVFLLFLLAGFMVQSFGLYLRGVATHEFPLQNTFEVFQVVAWLAVAFNFITRILFRLQLLNFFASGLALLCSAVSLCVPGWDERVAVNATGNPWVNFHAAMAIASYAVFSVLALTSVMYLIQDRALSRRKSGNLSLRLPAIGQLEAVNTKLITLGVALLTISMAVGALNMWEDSANVRGIKLAIACTVWIGYLIILILRRRRHLIGRPFARACVTVFLYALCLLWPLTYRPPLPTVIQQQVEQEQETAQVQQSPQGDSGQSMEQSQIVLLVPIPEASSAAETQRSKGALSSPEVQPLQGAKPAPQAAETTDDPAGSASTGTDSDSATPESELRQPVPSKSTSPATPPALRQQRNQSVPQNIPQQGTVPTGTAPVPEPVPVAEESAAQPSASVQPSAAATQAKSAIAPVGNSLSFVHFSLSSRIFV